MSTLERAIAIAAEAHTGQTDKAKAPYILHPLRVMMALDTEEQKIVGVLHDVVEDCDAWTFERLREEGFSEAVLDAIDAVSEREGEDYEEFVRRASQNSIGAQVKLADLRDNADLSRIANPSEEDRERSAKYARAIRELESRSASS